LINNNYTAKLHKFASIPAIIFFAKIENNKPFYNIYFTTLPQIFLAFFHFALQKSRFLATIKAE